LVIGAWGLGVAIDKISPCEEIKGISLPRDFGKVEWAIDLNAECAVIVILIGTSGVIFKAQRDSACQRFLEIQQKKLN